MTDSESLIFYIKFKMRHYQKLSTQNQNIFLSTFHEAKYFFSTIDQLGVMAV